MEEWKEYRLGELLTIKYGKDHKKLHDGSIPAYGSGGIMRYVNKSIYEHSSILIPRKGSLNNIIYIGTPFWTVDTMFWTIINTELVNPKYLYYAICKFDFAGLNVGSAVPSLTVPVIENIKITLPSLNKQKRIANILSSLDDKIELNRRINENLEQQAQALFKSWFVDFEPFKDGKFVDSELGMIPEGWRVGTIGDYCKIRSGFAFKSSWWTERGVKIVKIKNISSSGILNMDDCSYVSKENVSKAKEFSLKSGDILIAMTGATIGKFCLVPALKEEIYVNQRVGKFFLGENPIMKIPFIHGLLKCENIISQIMNKGQGSAQPNISGNDIETIPIIYPPEDIILKYNELVSPYFSMIIENISACDFISQLRDTLLPRLMSGKLEIKDNSYD